MHPRDQQRKMAVPNNPIRLSKEATRVALEMRFSAEVAKRQDMSRR